MHTVRRIGNTWRVQLVEPGAEPGYRATRETIAAFGRPWDAYSFCSFMNGGGWPQMTTEGREELYKGNIPFADEDLED